MPDQPLNPLDSNFSIRPAVFPEEAELVRRLFRDYQANIQVDLCFQSFEQELAALPGKYEAVLLGVVEGEAVGCVALRPYAEGVGEMKRLYVDPARRGRGRGRRLAEALLAEARARGYERVHLDTIPGKMDAAIAMYRQLGFVDVAEEQSASGLRLLHMEVAL